jgi:hypothetical protein
MCRKASLRMDRALSFERHKVGGEFFPIFVQV